MAVARTILLYLGEGNQFCCRKWSKKIPHEFTAPFKSLIEHIRLNMPFLAHFLLQASNFIKDFSIA